MAASQKVQYFLLNQEEGNSYSRKFPEHENNIALKVIFEAVLEQMILGKTETSLDKIVDFVLHFFRQNNPDKYGLPELNTQIFGSRLAHFSKEVKDRIRQYEDKIEMIDDFYLIFANKYEDVISILFKAMLVAVGVSNNIASRLRSRDTVFDYSGQAFEELLALVGWLFNRRALLKVDGKDTGYRDVSSSFKSGDIDIGKHKNKFEFKGYKDMKFMAKGNMLSIIQDKDYFEYYGMNKDKQESIFINKNGPGNKDMDEMMDNVFGPIKKEGNVQDNFMDSQFMTKKNMFDPYTMYKEEIGKKKKAEELKYASVNPHKEDKDLISNYMSTPTESEKNVEYSSGQGDYNQKQRVMMGAGNTGQTQKSMTPFVSLPQRVVIPKRPRSQVEDVANNASRLISNPQGQQQVLAKSQTMPKAQGPTQIGTRTIINQVPSQQKVQYFQNMPGGVKQRVLIQPNAQATQDLTEAAQQKVLVQPNMQPTQYLTQAIKQRILVQPNTQHIQTQSKVTEREHHIRTVLFKPGNQQSRPQTEQKIVLVGDLSSENLTLSNPNYNMNPEQGTFQKGSEQNIDTKSKFLYNHGNTGYSGEKQGQQLSQVEEVLSDIIPNAQRIAHTTPKGQGTQPQVKNPSLVGNYTEESNNDTNLVKNTMEEKLEKVVKCRLCTEEFPYQHVFHTEGSFFCRKCFGRMSQRLRKEHLLKCAFCKKEKADFTVIKYFLINEQIENIGTLSFTKPKNVDKLLEYLVQVSDWEKEKDLEYKTLVDKINRNLTVPISTVAKMRVCNNCESQIAKCCMCSSKSMKQELFTGENCKHMYCMDCLSFVFLKKYSVKKEFSCKSGFFCRKPTSLELAKKYLNKQLTKLEVNIGENMTTRVTRHHASSKVTGDGIVSFLDSVSSY